jgi:hypothetical protein
MKIKSFCFGTNFSGVEVKGTTVGMVTVDVGVEGSSLIGCSCGAAQEARAKVIENTKI